MKWSIRNTLTTITDATDAEGEWLRDYLSYEDRHYVPRTGRFTSERVSLVHPVRRTFPTGFARMAFIEARTKGITIEFVDERVCPCAPDLSADLEWLQHHPAVDGEITHQIEAVQAVVKNKRGIIWSPTGSGKGSIAVGIAVALPCRWLFLVHRADLVGQQAARYLKHTGLEAGTLVDGAAAVPKDCRFIVATFQSVYSGIKRNDANILAMLGGAEGIILDECHAVAATTYLAVTMSATGAYYRVGMSGTPLARSDGRNLMVIGGLGPVIYRVLPEELIRVGLLARPTIRMVEVRQECARATWRGVYSEAVVRSTTRNRAIVAAVQRATKPCLVFVQHIRHGKMLKGLLECEGLRVEFVYGKEPLPIRRAAIKRLERGEIEVLVCNVIFQEGVDIPTLSSVVIAAAGASTIAALQRIGRGMRADRGTGKTMFEVWDFYDRDCGCGDGPPNEMHTGCKWLRRHSNERRKAYESEGYEVAIITQDGGCHGQEGENSTATRRGSHRVPRRAYRSLELCGDASSEK